MSQVLVFSATPLVKVIIISSLSAATRLRFGIVSSLKLPLYHQFRLMKLLCELVLRLCLGSKKRFAS